jgi:hypothetical protein
MRTIKTVMASIMRPNRSWAMFAGGQEITAGEYRQIARYRLAKIGDNRW